MKGEDTFAYIVLGGLELFIFSFLAYTDGYMGLSKFLFYSSAVMFVVGFCGLVRLKFYRRN